MSTKMNIAFIVGNGVSRANFDLNKLKKLGTIFGCNALYREFEPDWIVAIDPKIIEEIQKSNFDQSKVLIPPENEHWEPEEMHPGRHRPRSNAGMNAMIEAIKKGYNHLICLGFDFLVVDGEMATDNIYANTPSYGPETHASLPDTRARMGFLEFVLKKHNNVFFSFVYPKNISIYRPVADNVDIVSYDELEKEIEKNEW